MKGLRLFTQRDGTLPQTQGIDISDQEKRMKKTLCFHFFLLSSVLTWTVILFQTWKSALCFRLYSTLLMPVRVHGVCSLVSREILSEGRSELRSGALPATTIDFSGIRISESLHTNGIF